MILIELIISLRKINACYMYTFITRINIIILQFDTFSVEELVINHLSCAQ